MISNEKAIYLRIAQDAF